jgi:hypothetical protein
LCEDVVAYRSKTMFGHDVVAVQSVSLEH